MPKNESRWARWFWKDRKALGRWHAIAEEGAGVDKNGVKHPIVVLACGRVRRPPTETQARPEDAQCCPECRAFDDIRLSYLDQRKPVETPELVTAGG